MVASARRKHNFIATNGPCPRCGSLEVSDCDSRNFEGAPYHAVVLNHAMSALPADLHAKGLLHQTLVVLGTEFGRTPWDEE